MHIVTQRRLDTANYAVTRELQVLCFYDPPIQEIETCLVAFGIPYGWQHYRGSGHINIPRISFSRLTDLWTGSYTSLRDILRHEFGHALADTHRGLFRSRRFSDAFGASHDSEVEWEHDPKHHVSLYAAANPAEDFAESFMIYVRHHGRLPSKLATTTVRRKWRFIDELRNAVSTGRRRW